MDFATEEAIKVEMEHFSELAFTDVARSLIGLFLSEQYVSKKAKSLASSVDKINNAAVLGAGIKVKAIRSGEENKVAEIEMLELTEERRAKLISAIETNGYIPKSAF